MWTFIWVWFTRVYKLLTSLLQTHPRQFCEMGEWWQTTSDKSVSGAWQSNSTMPKKEHISPSGFVCWCAACICSIPVTYYFNLSGNPQETSLFFLLDNKLFIAYCNPSQNNIKQISHWNIAAKYQTLLCLSHRGIFFSSCRFYYSFIVTVELFICLFLNKLQRFLLPEA